MPVNTARAGAALYTQAVLCSCPLGAWVAAHSGERRPMRLEEYRSINPRWDVQLAQRAREQKALADLEPASPKWAATVERLRGYVGIPADALGEE